MIDPIYIGGEGIYTLDDGFYGIFKAPGVGKPRPKGSNFFPSLRSSNEPEVTLKTKGERWQN
jgi:hypothetical protein